MGALMAVNRKRPQSIKVMLTDAEKLLVERAAARLGLATSAWMRSLALEKAQ